MMLRRSLRVCMLRKRNLQESHSRERGARFEIKRQIFRLTRDRDAQERCRNPKSAPLTWLKLYLDNKSIVNQGIFHISFPNQRSTHMISLNPLFSFPISSLLGTRQLLKSK